MDKARRSPADALILDLEDSVSLQNKPAAREHSAAFLQAPERPRQVLVRINSLASGMAAADLAAIVAARPDGIVLPKAQGAGAIRELARQIPEGLAHPADRDRNAVRGVPARRVRRRRRTAAGADLGRRGPVGCHRRPLGTQR
jgi:citrate lyase beta subunit